MSITVAMYSHDSVGLGHARRNRALTHALAADLPRITGESVRGLLIVGHPDAAADTLPPGWDWLVLPGFIRTSEGYASRKLTLSVERLTALRSSTVTAALDAVSPDLFIVDRHPFGVGGELKPALDMLRQRRTTTVLGMRDVLDTPEVVQAEWCRAGTAAVAEAFDSLWIYGDRTVYDPLATGEIPTQLAARSRFTGYLAHGRPEDRGAESVGAQQPYVLTMVGGGSDGHNIGMAAARTRAPLGHRHIILTGPQMPAEDHAEIVEAVDEARSSGHVPPMPGGYPAVTVQRYVPHVPHLVREASAVVSMGGYNSVAEVMATTTPALIIPRSTRRAEQPRRAAALAAVGAVDTLDAAALSPQRLGRWLSSAVRRRTPRDGLDLDGLTRLGDIAAEQLLGAGVLNAPHLPTVSVSALSPTTAEEHIDDPHREALSHVR